MNRIVKTLTLKKPPDPKKIELSMLLSLRFIERKGRYMLQAYVNISTNQDDNLTWVDIPLVPEVYE